MSGAADAPATTAGTLHATAHQVLLRERRADDTWGAPLESALAISSLAVHTEEYRDEALAGLRRLRRQLDDGELGLSGRDVAALALAARAAVELEHRDRVLEATARDSLTQVLDQRLALPALHAAFVAWALGPLSDDRLDDPWPALRAHVHALAPRGLDEALLALADAFAAERVNHGPLLQKLIAAAARPTGLSEMCVLAWVLDRALEEAVGSVPGTDNALQFLLVRRTELIERLASEVGLGRFEPPQIEEFDPDADGDPLMGVEHLSLFEASLLDWVLAPRSAPEALVTLAEAEKLFGARAAALTEDARQAADEAKDKLDTERIDGWRRVCWTAMLAAGFAGVLAGVLVDANGEYSFGRTLSVGLLVFLAGSLGAMHLRSKAPDAVPSLESWAFVLTLLVAGGFVYVDQTRTTPSLSEPAGFLAQLVIAALVLAIAAALVRRGR